MEQGYVLTDGNIYHAEETKKEITETVEVKKTDHADSYDNITKHDNMEEVAMLVETMAENEAKNLPFPRELILISERTRLITTFTEGKKTTSQEIDQKELEGQENEDETFEEQELDLENIEQEQTAQ
ncbi:7855_t:CDS:2, partial [Funneliformis geosporum]